MSRGTSQGGVGWSMKASGLGAEPLQRPPLEESRELLNLSDAYLVSAYWSSIS